MPATTPANPAWNRQSLTGVPVLQIHPTLRCNLTCAHCYSSSGPAAREELPVDLLVRAVEDAAALGYGQLSVSGGEPLLYDGLAVVLSRAREVGMATSLVTNGLLLRTRRWARVAPLLDLAAVSVDGSEDAHDLMRGRAGAWRRTVAGLEALRGAGTPYALITTLTQYNADGLEAVVRLAASYGARAVQVHPLSAMGRAEAMTGFRPDGTELLASFAEAAWLGRTYGVPVVLDAVTREQLAAFHDAFVPPGDRLAELATTLVVAADASVRPLTWDVDESLHLGRLQSSSLIELAERWQGSDAPARLRSACRRAWNHLTAPSAPVASYWYDEVAAQSAACIAQPAVAS